MEIGKYHIDIENNTHLYYTVDYLDSSMINTTGSHVYWDMSEVKSPIVKKIQLSKINLHTSVNVEALEANDGYDIRFYEQSGYKLNEIGFELKMKNHSKYRVLYDTPLYFSEKKLFYGARFSDSTSFSFEVEREDLPYEIKGNLPKHIDRVKVFGKIKRRYHYDADGIFEFEDKNVSALRMRVLENVELRLYDMISGDEVPVYNKEVLKKIYSQVGRNIYYLFFSNIHKYYFAKVRYSMASHSYTIEYQNDSAIEDNVLILKDAKKLFLLYPNPTYDYSKIIFSHYNPGRYKLEIYNIIGKKIWDDDIELEDNTLLKYNFSFLRKGTYLVALRDKYGNIIATRKLIIISV